MPMPRFRLNNLSSSQRIQLVGEFYDVISSLKNREEAKMFLRDLLSGSEIAMLMRRIETAALLLAGYHEWEIRETTSIGGSACKAVKTKLNYGDRGEGYRIVVKRLLTKRKKQIQKELRREREAGDPWAQMKRKYKTHHLLEHILDSILDYHERKNDKALAKEALARTPSRKC